MTSKLSCSRPWDGIYINAIGMISPCTLLTNAGNYGEFDDSIASRFINNKSIHSDDVIELREEHQSVNVSNSHCTGCLYDYETDQQRDTNFRNLSDYDGTIEYANIAFGNKCNLACRMCSSENSTKFTKLMILECKVHEVVKFHERVYTASTDDHVDLYDQITPDVLFRLVDGVRKLTIHGGEPMLYQSEIIDLLNNIDLEKIEYFSIHTNGTIKMKSQLKLTLERLNIRPEFIFSIDGTPDVSDYIRIGSYFPTIENNITDYKNIGNIKIKTVATAYNWVNLGEFIRYLVDKEYQWNISDWNVNNNGFSNHNSVSSLSKDEISQGILNMLSVLTELNVKSEFHMILNRNICKIIRTINKSESPNEKHRHIRLQVQSLIDSYLEK